jgi:signal transduction histidine kinase
VVNDGTLPPAIEGSLFAPFVRPGKTSGTGLGLFIVDQIARAHGGAVCGSSAGGRTTFTLTLPRHVPITPASLTS